MIAVGGAMKKASCGFAGKHYEADDAGAAGSILSGIMTKGDTVLIKGSRGMHMEKVLSGNGETAGGTGKNAL